MKTIKLFIAILLLSCVGTLKAQTNTVSLLSMEPGGKMAVFSVNAAADKSGDVVSEAIRQLFIALLDNGVAGIENGTKLMSKPHPKWRENFLKAKNPPYMMYVKGYQSEGEPIRNEVGTYEGTVLVRVNMDFLLRQLKANGLRN